MNESDDDDQRQFHVTIGIFLAFHVSHLCESGIKDWFKWKKIQFKNQCEA